ncbi:MAG: Hpt domain-containing protein, partial [Candidatus Binatia bacterium]
MQINMDQFRNAFFEEAEEHLASMEAGLLQLESTPHDLELLHAIFRGAHSIKGGSGMFGFADMIRFTHVMESLLDLMRDGKISATAPLTDLLLRATDILRTLVTIAKEGGEPPAAMESTLHELQQALNAETEAFPPVPTGGEATLPANAAALAQEYRILFKPDRDLFRQGMEPLLLLRDLNALGETLDVQADCSQLPDLVHLDPESCYLAWSLTLKTDKSEKELRE